MSQISAMINLKAKFEGSSNRPCAKHNKEQQESRRVCAELRRVVLVVTNGCTCANPGRYPGSFSPWKRAPGIKMRKTSFFAQI